MEPATWNIGKPLTMTSRSVIAYICAADQAEWSWLPWLCCASLGAPVVPPVWNNAASVSARVSRAPPSSAASAMARPGRVEIHGTVRRGRAADREHVPQTRATLAQPRHARPDVQLRMRPERDEDVGPRRADQTGDVLAVQKVVDRAGDTDRLGAPHREVGLGDRRQQHRHPRRVGARHRAKEVRGPTHIRHELAVGPARRRRRVVGRAHERQRLARRMFLRRVVQRRVDALVRHERAIGLRLDGFDVGHRRDGADVHRAPINPSCSATTERSPGRRSGCRAAGCRSRRRAARP